MTGRTCALDTVGREVLRGKLWIGDVTVRTEDLIGISCDSLTTVIDILTNLHTCSVIYVCSLQALIDSELGSLVEELDDIFTHTIMIFFVDRNTIKDPVHLDREELIRDGRTLKVEILDDTTIFQQSQISGISLITIHTSTVALDKLLKLLECIIITDLLQDIDLLVSMSTVDLLHDTFHTLRTDRLTTAITVGITYLGIQQSEIIINLGQCTNGGSDITHTLVLLNCNSW